MSAFRLSRSDREGFFFCAVGLACVLLCVWFIEQEFERDASVVGICAHTCRRCECSRDARHGTLRLRLDA